MARRERWCLPMLSTWLIIITDFLYCNLPQRKSSLNQNAMIFSLQIPFSIHSESLNNGSPWERRHSLTIFKIFSGSRASADSG